MFFDKFVDVFRFISLSVQDIGRFLTYAYSYQDVPVVGGATCSRSPTATFFLIFHNSVLNFEKVDSCLAAILVVVFVRLDAHWLVVG